MPAVFLGQGVWDDNNCETPPPSVRLLSGNPKSLARNCMDVPLIAVLSFDMLLYDYTSV